MGKSKSNMDTETQKKQNHSYINGDMDKDTYHKKGSKKCEKPTASI